MAFSPELAKFSITILEQFFLTVGKNNFQNKIPVLPSSGWRQKEPQQKILNASRNALAAYRRKTKTWETTAREITKLGSKRQIFTFLFLVHHYNLAMISSIAYTLVWIHFSRTLWHVLQTILRTIFELDFVTGLNKFGLSKF